MTNFEGSTLNSRIREKCAHFSPHLSLISFFYSSYCLDIYVRSENHILVRDGAISLFNQGKAIDDCQPIPFIKNFLLKYVDEAALQRRQSQAG